jgi:fibro-slime domain-containing protein
MICSPRAQGTYAGMNRNIGALLTTLGVVVTCSACGSNKGNAVSAVTASSGAAGTPVGMNPGITLNVGGSTGILVANDAGTNEDAGTAAQIIASLPAGYTQTDVGGYELGVSLSDADAGAIAAAGSGGTTTAQTGNCGNILLGVVRDFRGADEPNGHPDFEAALAGDGVTPNLVASMLGADQKPVYASQCEVDNPSPPPICPFGAQTTTKANFDEWYRDTPGVNEPYEVSLYLAPQAGGLFTFQSLEYFPLDNAGFGNSALGDDGLMHNFSFTTEIHTQFAYSGGETFQFEGDDDVWVFINNVLAVDLGGLHPKATGKVTLDDAASMLGIAKGNVYPLDLFHAERHTSQSTFRIDTNLSFVNCGVVLSPVVK